MAGVDYFGRNVAASFLVAAAWFLVFTYTTALWPLLVGTVVLPALFALIEWGVLKGHLQERLSAALAMPILPAVAMWYCCAATMELLILVYGLVVLAPYWISILVLAVIYKLKNNE